MPKSCLIFCITLCCIALSPYRLIAQNSDGWPVETACMEVIEPPEGWTFPGLILFNGEYGVHATSMEFDSTFVVAFIDRRVAGSAGLSPDGKWYATQIGDFIPGGRDGEDSWLIRELRLFDIGIARESFSIPLAVRREVPGQLRWRDESRLIYLDADDSLKIANANTRQVTRWESALNPLADFGVLFPSPDWTHAIYNTSPNPAVQTWELIAPVSASTIAPLDLAVEGQIAWKPDSSGFAAEISGGMGEDNPIFQVALFDRAGTLKQILFSMPEGQRILGSFDTDIRNMIWSPDGRYLALISTHLAAFPLVNELYIIDIEEQRVIDPCLDVSDGLSWSPDGTRLAFTAEPTAETQLQRPVMVFDLVNNQLVRFRQHPGAVIGWRE
jgi:hypothetical protein